jgi:hypothetical protein
MRIRSNFHQVAANDDWTAIMAQMKPSPAPAG